MDEELLNIQNLTYVSIHSAGVNSNIFEINAKFRNIEREMQQPSAAYEEFLKWKS